MLAISVMLMENAVFSPKFNRQAVKVCKFCRGSSTCGHVKPDLKQKSVTLALTEEVSQISNYLSFFLASVSDEPCFVSVWGDGRPCVACGASAQPHWLPLSSNDRWQIKKAKKEESKTEVNRMKHKCEWMNLMCVSYMCRRALIFSTCVESQYVYFLRVIESDTSRCMFVSIGTKWCKQWHTGSIPVL